jgi:hypothetical protein
MTEVIHSSKMLVSTYKTTWLHYQEDHGQQNTNYSASSTEILASNTMLK